MLAGRDGVRTQLLSQNEGGKFLADNGMESKQKTLVFFKYDSYILYVTPIAKWISIDMKDNKFPPKIAHFCKVKIINKSDYCLFPPNKTNLCLINIKII